MSVNSIQDTIVEMERVLLLSVPLLKAIDDDTFGLKVSPEKWSKKEILGHLLDSATNNHQRFIRVQFEDSPALWYEQNQWVTLNKYQDYDKVKLISLWEQYNRHLLHVISHIPCIHLNQTCQMKDGSHVTLEFLVVDYLDHMKHHLRQILGDIFQ